MTIQVNIGDHASPYAPDYIAVPFAHRWATNWARARAKLIAAKMPSADNYFRTLPGRRSLSQILADRTVWINFAPNIGYYGETADDKELAIGPLAYRWGRWTVLGTLIHELAHANGAPGDASKAAEEALLHCGLGKLSELRSGQDDLGTPYVPGIEG